MARWSRSKSSVGRYDGFFDGTAVVALVAGQGGAACERLLTVCIWTFVRSFSGMNPPMPGERARVTERLRMH